MSVISNLGKIITRLMNLERWFVRYVVKNLRRLTQVRSTAVKNVTTKQLIGGDVKDLSKAKIISLDIETFDPGIAKKLGAGVYRNDGYILGVAISDGEGYSNYFNLGHYDCTKAEREENVKYLREVLALDIPKLGTNLMYDIDWLENWQGSEKHGWRGEAPQFKVNGLLYDIQIAEPIIDENQGRYSLDFQANKYLNIGKAKDEIDEFCEDNGLKGDSRRWLWKMPSSLVRKYAIADVELPLEIFRKQWVIMQEDNLLNVFELETKLLRAMLHMRRNGVLIDENRRDRNIMTAQNEFEKKYYELIDKYGEVNFNSTFQLADLFDKNDVPYNFKVTFEDGDSTVVEHKVGKAIKEGKAEDYRVELKGRTDEIKNCNPTIPREYLTSLEEEYPQIADIMFVRKADRMINAFLNGSLVDYITDDGLIHPEIRNVRDDNYGTRSGRFSMTNPNLQQIPALSTDYYWGKLCREVFVPLENCWWAKIDYSQIEYRCLAHFANGPGSEDLVESYNVNPKTDYHQYVMDLTGLSRKFAKNLNFGLAYGMGRYHMAELFNWTLEYAEEVLDIYHSKAPYVRATVKNVERVAKNRGYIKTLAGRRSRLVDRNKAYVMFNRLLQGSAADIMKKGMLDIYEAGLVGDIRNFDEDYKKGKVFEHLTVHDELGFSVPKTVEGIRTLYEVKQKMQDAYKLKIPIIADVEIGPNWAEGAEFEMSKEWLNSLTDENVIEKVEIWKN